MILRSRDGELVYESVVDVFSRLSEALGGLLKPEISRSESFEAWQERSAALIEECRRFKR